MRLRRFSRQTLVQTRQRSWRWIVAAVGLALLEVGCSVLPAQARPSGASCADLNFPVSLAGQAQAMHGKLCVPEGGTKTVQVLIPGASYNSTYWDFPYQPEIHSFRLAMNNAGYATLALDRLGTGLSSKPLSAELTSFTQADVVHQVIQMLRNGEYTQPFTKVIIAGHSVGSAVTTIEAGTYHDVDAVVITGLTHGVNAVGATPILATALEPAILEPKFAGKGYDLGYVTTIPGTRYGSFQSPGAYDSQVAATDEATKDVFAPGEVVDTVLLGVLIPYSLNIKVPVFLAMGNDPAFCGGPTAPNCSSAETLRSAESPYYSQESHLQTYVVSDFGHALNYAPDAPLYYQAVAQWADSTVGH